MQRFFRSGLSIAALLSIALAAQAQGAPPLSSRAEVLALMHKVDDWQTAHPVMPVDDHNWERGTWYTGVMEAWKATGDARFLNQALDWGKLNNWQMGTEKPGANRLFCAETWAELSLAKHDPQMIAPTEKWLATAAPNSPGGAARWYLDSGRPYVDSLYGAAVFPMLTKATHNRQYLATMHVFTRDIVTELWDQDAGLFYRDPSYIGKRSLRGNRPTASGEPISTIRTTFPTPRAAARRFSASATRGAFATIFLTGVNISLSSRSPMPRWLAQ
jgi:unsaturated rhamnogalacturonyl hydrolase